MRDRALFERLLGLESPWRVSEVEFDESEGSLLICVKWSKSVKLSCPICDRSVPGYDSVHRHWRHLDTFQYRTIIGAQVPRCECPEHGVLQIRVPWAEDQSHFTKLFERLAIDWLQESNRSAVARQMGLTWSEADGIMQRAVKRGLARRTAEVIPFLGVDEKSFKGHSYMTIVCDLFEGYVLYVGDDRKRSSLDAYYEGLTDEQLGGIGAVAMDMWEPFVLSTCDHVPEGSTKIVFDKYHISKHLNEAVDKIRKAEHKDLKAASNARLTGTKYWWLKNPEKISEEVWHAFEPLRKSDLRTARGWAIKETFRGFWEYTYTKPARKFFDRWYSWAIRSRLEPIKVVARMLKTHLPNILTYMRTPITNAMSEGLNSKIQLIKYRCRGFRNRKGFRNAIYFYYGGLDMHPL